MLRPWLLGPCLSTKLYSAFINSGNAQTPTHRRHDREVKLLGRNQSLIDVQRDAVGSGFGFQSSSRYPIRSACEIPFSIWENWLTFPSRNRELNVRLRDANGCQAICKQTCATSCKVRDAWWHPWVEKNWTLAMPARKWFEKNAAIRSNSWLWNLQNTLPHGNQQIKDQREAAIALSHLPPVEVRYKKSGREVGRVVLIRKLHLPCGLVMPGGCHTLLALPAASVKGWWSPVFHDCCWLWMSVVDSSTRAKQPLEIYADDDVAQIL